MVFEFLKRIGLRKPGYLVRLLFIFLVITFVSIANSARKEELKQVAQQGLTIKGVIFDRRKWVYSTFSASGHGPLFKPEDEAIHLAEFKSGSIRFVISAYPDSASQTRKVLDQVRFYPILPREIEKAVAWLGYSPAEITIELVILVGERSIFYETGKKPPIPPITLRFYESLDEEKVNNYASRVERFAVDGFPHELFHLLYQLNREPNTREIRKEAYAHLFGACVVYPLIKEAMIDKPINMAITEDSFKNPTKDLAFIRKKIKKQISGGNHIPTSMQGALISKYYFQAVANNHTGKKVQSDRIPAFCEKLFSEHNFRWPIEKKPPPWFAEFIHRRESAAALN